MYDYCCEPPKHHKDKYDCDYNIPYAGSGCLAPPMPKVGLAQAYVPVQPYVGIVSPQEGLQRGSIFPNLYEPMKSHGKYPMRNE